MPINSAQDLLAHELRDIEDAERQAAEALEQMSAQAEDDELREMLGRRRQEGERVLQAVEAALKVIDKKSEQAGESGARGIIEKALALTEEAGTPEMKRAVMIAGAQKLEHYCIAAWGTVKALAQEVEARELAQAMETAVEEGYRWDAEMSDLAESRVNPEAIEAETDGGR